MNVEWNTKIDYKRLGIVLWGVGLLTIIIGGCIIYSIIDYVPPQPYTLLGIIEFCVVFLSITIGLSWVVHGFNPLLLVKVDNNSKVIK